MCKCEIITHSMENIMELGNNNPFTNAGNDVSRTQISHFLHWGNVPEPPQSRTQSQWSPQSVVVVARLDSGGMEF